MSANIPVVDLVAPGRAEEDVARELCDAAVEHGFIYVREGEGDCEGGMVDGIFDISRKLFASPVEEKDGCRIQKNNRGWSGMHTETLDPKHQKVGDFKEAFNFGEFLDGKAQQPIPESIRGHQGEIAKFWERCHKLCLRIVYLLGVGLKVDPPDFFKQAHLPEKGPSGTTLRFLHYPRVEEGDVSEGIRAGAHSDYGSVTLLFRLAGQPGLQVLSKTNTWLPVPVHPPGTSSPSSSSPPPILVNIGDLLSYWTNGLLRSTVHRVIFPTTTSSKDEEGGIIKEETDAGDRYSIAFFCHPAGETVLEPVPSERVRGYVPEGKEEDGGRGEVNPYLERKVVTADEHLQMRLRASYLELYKDEK